MLPFRSPTTADGCPSRLATIGDEKAMGPPRLCEIGPVDQVSVQPDGTPTALDRTWAWVTATAGGARTTDTGPAATTSAVVPLRMADPPPPPPLPSVTPAPPGP